MDITYLGHASFKIKGKTSSLLTDPFDPGMVGLKFPKVEAAIVTVSHDHTDHNKAELVKNVKKVVKGPGAYDIEGVTIFGFSTFHDDKKGLDRGKNTIYAIEIDGVRIVHLGDLGHKLDENILEEIGTTDILMIPVGGVYTIGPGEASEVVREIEPSIVIPMHYFMEGMDEKMFGKLSKVDDFLSELSLGCERLDKLSLKKSDLTNEQKVVVLATQELAG